MNLNPIQANMNEVTVGNMIVLFSYKTPVACLIKEGDGWHQYKTDKKWSVTTSKHINKWNQLGGAYGLKSQEWFDTLLSEVK